MPRAAPIQSSFNAGEMSPKLEGRTDLAKYAAGCSLLENFLPQVQGPAVKRSGTRFVFPSKGQGRLIPFSFNVEQSYVLLFTNQRMVVLANGGAVLNTGQTITAITKANPAQVTVSTHGYSTGDQIYIDDGGDMVELNSRYFTITVVDGDNFTLNSENSTGYTTYTAGGEAASVVALGSSDVPYSLADLADIYYTQSADILYIAHPDHAPRAITRTSDTAWTCSAITFDWPPFNPVPDNTITLVCDDIAPGAGATLTASSSLFVAGDVGRIIRIGLDESPGEHPNSYFTWAAGTAVYSSLFSSTGNSDQVHYDGNVYVCSHAASGAVSSTSPPRHRKYLQEVYDGPNSTHNAGWTYLHSGWGYVEITAYSSATEVTVEVIKELPVSGDYHTTSGTPDSSHVATLNWSWGAWDDTSGYPTSVTFHEDRLWWGGTAEKPQTLWASRSGDYYDHEYWDSDEYALLVTINTDRVNAIEWLSSGQKLALGTSGGEYICSASSADEPITPSNIEIIRHSTLGSRDSVQPVQVENVVLFPQRSGRRLRELVYDFDTDSYIAPDLSVLADHMLHGQINEMAFQQEPNRVLWVALDDGALVAMTYDRAQEVVGWHRHILGGSYGSGDPDVLSVVSIPHPDGDQDQLWMLVRRTVNSNTVWYVEYLEADWNENDDDEDAFFVDSGLTYDGSPATTILGLNHLEGAAVDVLADGSVITGKTVSGGKITLSSAASVVQVGLNYVAKLGTMRFEAGSATGTAQGKTKRIVNVVVRCYQVGDGLRYGAQDDSSTMEEMALRDTYDIMGTPADWFDGDSEELPWPWGYEQRGRVYLHHYKATPCTITAIMPRLETEDD